MDRTDRRKRATKSIAIEGAPKGLVTAAGPTGSGPSCVVCGTRDARLLVMVELTGGAGATLCGSHAVMHHRTGATSRSVAELRDALAERRGSDRRGRGEGDELAERLTAAFARDRRGSERRAS